VSNLRTLLVILTTFAALSVSVAWQGGRQEDAPSRLPVLQERGPRWYQGNLHTHSFWSDGDDFPEMIADWYRQHGYHFLALSDHNVLSDGERWLTWSDKGTRPQALARYRARFGSHWVESRQHDGKTQVRLKPLAEFRSLLEEPGKFLLIPAEEISSSFKKLPVHINAINLRDAIKPISGDGVPETIAVNHRLVADQARRMRRPILASLNHPNFGWGVRAEDFAGVDEVRFFEVYNGHPSVRNDGDALHPDTEQLWDIVLALRLGKRRLGVVYGLATDDAHGYHVWGIGKVNPGRGWVMVRAPYLSAEAIVRALDAGDFYSSTGVVLDKVTRTADEIALEIRPEKGVTYRTQFIATLRGTSLESTPRRDKEGKPLPVTEVYDRGVGAVVAESSDLAPRYKVTGKELYVRARVISSKKHPNPFKKGDVEMAWVQPVVVGERGR
jgi:predicted metal-dependent phosphoesterase TrpH